MLLRAVIDAAAAEFQLDYLVSLDSTVATTITLAVVAVVGRRRANLALRARASERSGGRAIINSAASCWPAGDTAIDFFIRLVTKYWQAPLQLLVWLLFLLLWLLFPLFAIQKISRVWRFYFFRFPFHWPEYFLVWEAGKRQHDA